MELATEKQVKYAKSLMMKVGFTRLQETWVSLGLPAWDESETISETLAGLTKKQASALISALNVSDARFYAFN